MSDGRSQTGRTAPAPDRAAPDELAALLTRLFPEASDSSRAALVRQAQRRTFRRHEDVVSQGFASLAALVLKGHLGVVRLDPDGQQQMIRIVEPGVFVNVIALRYGPSAIDLVGLDDGVVALWAGDLVLALARRDAGLGVDLLQHALAGAGMLLQRVDGMTFDSVTRRLARILWTQRDLLFDPRRPLLSRPQLADLAGATREMTGRIIRDFERRGIVARIGQAGLVLLEPDRLRAEAGVDAQDDELPGS